MHNPHEHEVENHKVRVRCPECRITFHERLSRVIRGEPVACPTCHNAMRFHGLHRIHEHDSVASYIAYVEARTTHPHFSLIA